MIQILPFTYTDENTPYFPVLTYSIVELNNEVQNAGIFESLGNLDEATLVTEEGLAGLMCKCKASIKHAVERGELPRPVKLMGKNTWTVGAIIRHLEARLNKEKNKFLKNSI